MTEDSPVSNTSLSRVSGGCSARSRLSPESRGRAQLGGQPVNAQHADRPPSAAEPTYSLDPVVAEVFFPLAMGTVHGPQSVERHPLCGVLFCRCGAPFHRSDSPGARREYMTVCGCRLRPIDADTIERRVHAAGNRVSEEAATVDQSALRTRDPFAGGRIEVGGTLDDIRFVPRP
jgi:hypothetical protein